jgi:penicillin V acylase-like amidase (Ntn superfamily)
MNKRLKQIIVVLCVCCAAFPVNVADACSRAVYFGKQGQTVTGCAMDWQEDMHTDLWIFPRGMNRDGGMGEKGFKWTSRYGSVISSIYEAGTADGMNEKGLVANLLFLV